MEKPYQSMLHHILESLPEEELFLFLQEALQTLSPEKQKQLMDALDAPATTTATTEVDDPPSTPNVQPEQPNQTRSSAASELESADQIFKQFVAQANSSFQDDHTRMKRQAVGCFVTVVVGTLLLIAAMNWRILWAMLAG